MLKSSSAMAGATLVSRLLGMVREIVYARFMGDGPVAGAFQFAFTIPNLFRRLLGEGALTAAFIPIFKEKEKTHGEIEMWRAANAVISGLIVAASVVVALAMIGLSLALAVHQFDASTELMLRLLRVMFPYMILVCLAAAMMGMLNARGHFFIPAMGATMLNVVMIASVLWLAPTMGLDLPKEERLPHQIFALAIGVLAAGVAQAAFQINVTLVLAIAFWVNPQIVASFNYAVRLMELPQGMFGISLATYLLPTLSSLAAEKNYSEFRGTLRHGLGTLLFLNLIAAILLVVLAQPIVRLIFEHGKFTAESTDRAALALMCLAPGLVAFSSVNILARAFFALGDTQTPMKISIACLVMNCLMAAILVVPLKQGGLGIANTVTSICNVSLLAFALRKKLGKLEMEPLRKTFLPLAVAGLLAGLLAWAGWRLWESQIGHATIALKIGEVFAPAGIAGGVYLLTALAFKIPMAKEMTEFTLAKFKR